MSSTETPAPDGDGSSGEQSFLSHLVELRQRLVRAALAIVIVFLALTPFMKQIFDLLSHPLMVALPAGTKLLATGVITPFMVPLKLTLFTAFIIALPYVLYQVWSFVAPGLYKHEKRLALPIIATSVLMFGLGMAYCYFVVFGFVFKFIAGFAPSSVAVAPDIEAYFGFVLSMFLAFGLTFEVPIIVVLLARFGIASVEKLKQARPYVIVGAFIVAAIFTPPDVLSQLLLAIPLCLLYELGLQIARFVVKPKADEAPSAAA
ncbi:MAG: twin-arginine translocase subunit TatC [Burkholderiaceae bacterium]|nr:twin-arginine translocase subunit TatC [Burkholderiaceae bacterium]